MATNYSSSLSSLYSYENYLAEQLPVTWQPVQAVSLNEIGKNVCGVVPQNVLLNWVAENWHFCRPAK